MGHSNGKITAPLNTDDVSQTIGEASSDIGTLCTSDKICKYSRYKPYAFGDMSCLTDAEMKDNNYGMEPKLIQLVVSLVSNKGVAPWGQWVLPGEGYWKRLTDFDGYIHSAVKFVTSVRIRSTAGEQYTTPIYNDHTSREAGLIGEVELAYTEGLRLADFMVDGMKNNLGDYYLTLVLMSEDMGGTGCWAAQADTPIRQIGSGIANVYMSTTSIDRDALIDLGGNIVVLGLSPKIEIGPNYSVDMSSLGSLWSLDMWGDGFQHAAYNTGTAQVGDGGAGGQPVFTYLDFYGRFANTPPLSFNFTGNVDGTITLSVGSNTNVIVWTEVPEGVYLSDEVKLYINVALSPVQGGATIMQSFEIPREQSGNTNEIIVLDPQSFTFDAEGIDGEISTTATFYITASKLTNNMQYRFFDADTGGELSVTVQGNTFYI